MFSLALLAAAASSILPTASATLAPIVRKGPYLFDSSSGDRFFIKGAAYPANYGSSQTQPDGSISKLDPLANTDGCKRDVSYFQELGINLIRVYQANSSLDHSECMSALDSAGIYVLLDLATPSDNGAISSSSPSWNTGLMTSFLSTVDAFGAYTNGTLFASSSIIDRMSLAVHVGNGGSSSYVLCFERRAPSAAGHMLHLARGIGAFSM